MPNSFLKQKCSVFERIKQELEVAALKQIDESPPFEVECDVSKTLQQSELKYHIIEKESIAIVEAVQKWTHYLTRQHFILITYQRSVAFMSSNENRTKIKNAKIQEWGLELSTLDYTKYRPGEENVVPDSLSYTYTSSLINSSTLFDLHNGLCHPRIMRLLDFVRGKKPSLFYWGCKKKKRCVLHAESVLRLNFVSIFPQKHSYQGNQPHGKIK